jgi:hypothetical protein
MTYVPKVRNDVFVSYCHDDNISELPDQRGWITDFSERLKVRLKMLLGAPVDVWWDRRLGGDHALDLEIRTRIEGAAVFLAIVSPSYLNSDYCTQERQWFRDAIGDRMLVGSRMRGIRVVKTPRSDGLHRSVFKEGLGFEFFVAAKDELDDVKEFLRSSREFHEEFGRVCGRVKGLLETMRRQQVAVYLAHCSPSLKDQRARLAAELTDQGYRILPEVKIDSDNVKEVAAEGLEAAKLSVHLFGTEEHDLSVRQARIAIEKGRPMVTWTSEPELHRKETAYGKFLLDLMRWSHYLDRRGLEDVKREVEKLLEPGEPPSLSGGGPRRVYILCNRAESEDIRRAYQIKKLIVERDHFEVDLPETAPLDPEDLIQDHHRKLQRCDGLLLYWDRADEGWFKTTRGDLDTRRFRSGAIALGNPGVNVATTEGAAPVIQLYPELRYEALEPFLQPLRR